MPKRAFILFLLLVTSFVTSVAAQTAATVSGIVLDPSGAVVPGVTVTAKSGATGLLRTAVTGPEGRYVLAQLPPGLYELRVELAGFKPHVRPDVPLDVAQSLTLNVTLQVGDLVPVGAAGAVAVPDGVDLRALVARMAGEPSRATALVEVRVGAGIALREAAVAVPGGRDGWDLLEVGYSDPERFADRVTGFGADAVVVSPDEARDAVVRRLQALAS